MCMLQGVTIDQVEAMPTIGFLKSASVNPTGRSIERAPARAGPSTMTEEWGRSGSGLWLMEILKCGKLEIGKRSERERELRVQSGAMAASTGVELGAKHTDRIGHRDTELQRIRNFFGWLSVPLRLCGKFLPVVFLVAWTAARRITRRNFTRMAFNLKKVLKALLLSSSHPLSVKDVQAAFARFHDKALLPSVASDPSSPEATTRQAGDVTEPVPIIEAAEVVAETPADPELYVDVPSLVTVTQIRETMDEIAAELRAADDGLLLIEGTNGYRLVTHPRFARWVRILRQEPPPVKLSQSSIETLAVVAYRQPVTRAEIETIRGVSAEAGINKLLERELIYVVGRADTPGRPTQFGTTDKFLEFVGIKNSNDLPASDVLSSRQIDQWLTNSSNAPKLTDTDMGLSDEQLPLENAGTPPAAAPAS